MSHPLITRLIEEFRYPCLRSMEDVAAFIGAPGDHAIFVPGDVTRNLETPDVAVILPELRRAFQDRFDCAVAADSVEAELRAHTKVHKTPSLIFFRDGALLAGIPKVRDWSEYIERAGKILSTPSAAQQPEGACS